MIRVTFIRHGRTFWNAGDGQPRRFRGTIDLPLSDKGISQAEATAQRMATWPLTAVYSSPLQRAYLSAQLIAEPHGLVAQKVPNLTSMDYGDWAGRSDDQVAQLWPDLFRQWRHDPYRTEVPGGESASDLRRRAANALRCLLASHHDGDTIVVVSHQIVTKSLVCELAGLPNDAFWRFRQGLCNLTHFDYDPAHGSFTLVGLNHTCHLEPQLPKVSGNGSRIVLVRHGQTAWNAGAPGATVLGQERFRGRTDLPLDKNGQAQAQAVALRLQDEPVAVLVASPLLRARQTLSPLSEAFGVKITPDDGLVDIDYGSFQGLTHAEAATAYPHLHELWRTNPGQVRFPDGEGLVDVQARLRALLDRLMERYPSQTTVLCGHQIVNKVLVSTLLGLELDQIWHVQQDTCGIDVFEQASDSWHTLCLNDTCHLESMATI